MSYPYSRTFYVCEQSRCPGSDKPPSSSQPSPAGVEYLVGHLRVLRVVRTSFWLLLTLPSDMLSSPSSTSVCFETVSCSSPEILIIYGARSTRAPYGVASESQVESQNQTEGHFSLFPLLFSKKLKNKSLMHISRSPRALNQNLLFCGQPLSKDLKLRI